MNATGGAVVTTAMEIAPDEETLARLDDATRTPDIHRRLLGLLQARPAESFSPAALAYALQLPALRVRDALKTLVANGRVLKAGPARYRAIR